LKITWTLQAKQVTNSRKVIECVAGKGQRNQLDSSYEKWRNAQS